MKYRMIHGEMGIIRSTEWSMVRWELYEVQNGPW